ncbi:GL11420 [Drosophila persimilis]|uniref:GL11420 n=1 Tax=Drosophila persimilis TaxID=7234 RepID=B4GAQ1_DROPE|nr:GL11420 [Drosophila persimilis]
MGVGVVNLISNIQHYGNAPFVVIYDEIHLKWGVRGNKWKVLAIAAFNLDGRNFHFLRLKLEVLGSHAIDSGLSFVLDNIRRRGYGPRLMCILCDGCPANILGKTNAAQEYSVLWDVVHLRKLFAEKFEVTDTVLEHWQDTGYPPVPTYTYDPDNTLRTRTITELAQKGKARKPSQTVSPLLLLPLPLSLPPLTTAPTIQTILIMKMY